MFETDPPVIPILQDLATNVKIRFETMEKAKCQGALSWEFKKL